jgi:hypothetical protein
MDEVIRAQIGMAVDQQDALADRLAGMAGQKLCTAACDVMRACRASTAALGEPTFKRAFFLPRRQKRRQKK